MDNLRLPKNHDPHNDEKARHLRENEMWLRDWSRQSTLSLDELEREGAPVGSKFEDDERPSRAA